MRSAIVCRSHIRTEPVTGALTWKPSALETEARGLMSDRTAHKTSGQPELQSETLSPTKDANQTNKQDLSWGMNSVCSVYDILHDKAQLLLAVVNPFLDGH